MDELMSVLSDLTYIYNQYVDHQQKAETLRENFDNNIKYLKDNYNLDIYKLAERKQ